MNKNQSKPLIGVTGPDKGGTAAWQFTRFAVWLQGGRSIRITPSSSRVAEDLDGLILGGGADIHPERYQQVEEELHSEVSPPADSWGVRLLSYLVYPMLFLVRKIFSTRSHGVDEQRDAIELDLLDDAITTGIPVLGICRGAQLINIQMGGDLHRDLSVFYREVPRIHSIWPRKKVTIDSTSHLYKMLQRETVMVNALHFQAVNRTGDQLKVVAREQSGVIQAIEHKDNPFLLGVQWHPEYMPQISRQRRIFKALVTRAGNTGLGE